MREIRISAATALVMLLIVLGSACQNTEFRQENNTPELASIPSSTPPPSGTPQPSPLNTPTFTPIPERPLDPEGPWLLLTSPEASWTIYNLDGTGQTQIALPEETMDIDIWGKITHISHNGRYLSAIMNIPEQPQLWVFRFPEGELVLQVPLVSEQAWNEIENFTPFNFDPAMEVHNPPVLSAIGDTAWSPDGRYLAFTGAIDGPSSDIYIFDTEINQTNRLTNGPNQARIMGWSPDSQTIVHYSAEWQVDNMELIESLWAVDVAGNVRELTVYNEFMIDPNIADWINNTTLVMFFPSFESNPNNLTIMNSLTGDTEIIEAPNFRHEIFYEASTNQLLINFGGVIGPVGNVGVYSYDLKTNILSTIIEDTRLIGKIQNTPHYISTSGDLLTSSGDIIGSLPGEAFDLQLPVCSPNGNWIIMYNQSSDSETGVNSLLMNANGESVHEWDFACREPIWLGDSSAFYCYIPVEDHGEWQILMIRQDDNWEPELINTIPSGWIRVLHP